MKIRRRTAEGSKHVRFTFVYEAIECGKVIAKDYTKDGLMRKLKAMADDVQASEQIPRGQ